MLATYSENIKQIKEKVIAIGDGLLEANRLILEALKDCDDEKFNEAKGYIKNISSKSDDIDNNIIKVLALYAPEARDLRSVISYLKITNELAKACSNTRSFIRGFTSVCTDVDVKTINEYALPMQSATIKAIESTIAMINCEDKDEIHEIYNEILIEENKTDDLYEMIERNLVDQAQKHNEFEKFHMMLRALRKSEKIASRTTSIANLLLYAKLGGTIKS